MDRLKEALATNWAQSGSSRVAVTWHLSWLHLNAKGLYKCPLCLRVEWPITLSAS